MKIVLSPLNSIVGDLSGNLALAKRAIDRALAQGANLLVFPELALVGYPPLDLVLRPGFARMAQEVILELRQYLAAAAGTREDFAVIIGTAWPSPEGCPEPVINAALFLSPKAELVRAKSLIPNYDIFHERRYFATGIDLPSSFTAPIDFLGKQIGILVCEDSWEEQIANGRKQYTASPIAHLKKQNVEFILNISASPFSLGKRERRRKLFQAAAREHKLPIAYVNVFGANDELIFDGDAFCTDPQGNIRFSNEFWSGKELAFRLEEPKQNPAIAAPISELRELRSALLLGIRDFVAKNNFSTCVLGLSGGVDSALVATLATEALGADKVVGFTLPSKYSSAHSLSDAESLAKNLGIHCESFSIKFLQSTFELALKPHFQNRASDLTEENLQARLRGIALMAMSNKFGHLLLTTGNKSELAVGYATLYGDMCGALSPIGDLFKTQVYALARALNEKHLRIPENTLTKAPSAELRPNQTDQDTLPDYAWLDRLLQLLVERELDVDDVEKILREEGLNADRDLIRSVEERVWKSEFKRHQYAPILRISEKAFGLGRRYPLTKRAFQSSRQKL